MFSCEVRLWLGVSADCVVDGDGYPSGPAEWEEVQNLLGQEIVVAKLDSYPRTQRRASRRT